MKYFLPVLILAGLLFAPTTLASEQTEAAEISFWESVRDSKEAVELEAYLKAYPNGTFAPLAQVRIKKLNSPPLKGRDLTLALQTELNRVGCYLGKLDGDWRSKSRKALASYNLHTKQQLPPDSPSIGILETVKENTDRVCPLSCGIKSYIEEERCVKKTCPWGQNLSKRGFCIKVVAKKKVKTRLKKPKKQKKDFCAGLNASAVCFGPSGWTAVP